MDINKILEELKAERQHIDEAIEALQRLAGSGKRRGRPPKWMVEAREKKDALKKQGRPPKTP